VTETPITTPVAARAGSIYDLGYRRYEGARLGRAHAVRTLIADSFRTTYGLGHGGRAKVAPLIFGAMAILPAVIVVGVLTLASRLGAREAFEEASPISYDSYYRSISVVIGLFCAAQAPELFSRDQRHGVIALYFARALRRSDYAVARLLGFGLALLGLLLVPMVVLLIGRVLLASDVAAAFGRDLPTLPAVVIQAVLIAALFGGFSMAVSAFTPRRAYATAGIVALFLVPGLVAEIVIGLGSSVIGTGLVLLSPGTILDGTTSLLFGKPLPERLFFFELPVWTFLISSLTLTAAMMGLIGRRFDRLPT
jgi:ABC-2 type transport system permease protein